MTSPANTKSAGAELRLVAGRLAHWRRTRPRAAAALAVVLGVGAVVGVVHWLPIDRRAPHAVASAPAPGRPLPYPAWAHPAPPGRTAPTDRTAVAATARRFALVWASDDRAGLAATATPALVARIDAAPATAAGTADGTARPTVSQLVVERVNARSARVLISLRLAWPTHPDRTDTTGSPAPVLSLALTLDRSDGRWRVSGAGAT